MNKPVLWQQVAQATIETQAALLHKCRFVIFDLSDLYEDYAQQMEGLTKVYDGSAKESGLGYWLCNVTAVDDHAQTVMPIYSELFSHTAEVTSANEKTLNAVNAVLPACAEDAIGIYDRGSDREVLLNAHLAAERQFIVRQTGERHLCYQGKKISFDFLTRKARLKWAYTIERIPKNKIRKRTYDCGALRVERNEALRTLNALLWMAVSFLYTRLESLALEIIFHPELAVVKRKKLEDVLRFMYYKLALAFKKIMARVRLYKEIAFPQTQQQTILPFSDPVPGMMGN